MKLLVLGGTLFLGRHAVEAALARGHEVTILSRGLTNPSLYPEVERLAGDRDGDLSALQGRSWDAVVDPSGYVPRVVRRSAELLADAVEHYVFVSSISVYRDLAEQGFDETYPLGELPRDHGENVGRFYGQLKAGSEEVVREIYGERAAVVRSGLIVGRYDWTNRFGWWVRRVALGGEVLVPDADPWPLQIVHGRDLAHWMLDLAERRVGGTFNATGPERPLDVHAVLEAAREASGSDASFVRVPERFLLEQGVEPFGDLPLWLALPENPGLAGFFSVDVSRALAAGLRFRPLAETISDTLAWERERGAAPDKDYGPSALATGLDPARERQLLATLRAREPLAGG
ncbi:MAG TPA: NAD-dependent epimerase/dehydratase family protein [Gaiellaceae bacterium]|nr:NAD-dependent epimerase/dehydratase family protein [Gaiellaceae bacterium]